MHVEMQRVRAVDEAASIRLRAARDLENVGDADPLDDRRLQVASEAASRVLM
jgi:hypothetical protein